MKGNSTDRCATCHCLTDTHPTYETLCKQNKELIDGYLTLINNAKALYGENLPPLISGVVKFCQEQIAGKWHA